MSEESRIAALEARLQSSARAADDGDLRAVKDIVRAAGEEA